MRPSPRALAALVALPLLIAAVPLGSGAGDPMDGVRAVILGDQVRFDVPDGGPGRALVQGPSAQAGSVAFVDRAHQNAIAVQTVVSGDGSDAFASWWLNNERVAKYAPATGRVWAQPGAAYGTHGLGVDATGDLATGVMAYSGPQARLVNQLALGTQVVGWPLGQGPQPLHQRLQEPCCQAATDVSRDGRVAVATYAPDGGTGDDMGLVMLYGPAMVPFWGALFSDSLNGAGGPFHVFQGVDISADGTTIVVTTYSTVFIYAFPDPEPVAVIPNNSQTVARVSGDGTYVAVGGFTFNAHLYQRSGDTYAKAWSRNVGSPWVTAIAVADDGTVLAGTFDYRSGNSGLAVALNADGTPRWTCACYGDYVDDVAITPDGARGAAVTWGTFGGAGGDLLTAFDMGSGTALFRLGSGTDDVGSLHTVALSDDGKVLLAGGKAVHARTFGNGGMVYSIALS